MRPGLAKGDLSTFSGGTFSYLDAGGEQDVVEITPTTRVKIVGIWLDLSNMTQNGTIKLYHKIDGTNYRQLSIYGTEQSYAFTVGDGVDGLMIPYNFYVDSDFKVTYEEGADEGAARDIPYNLFYEERE